MLEKVFPVQDKECLTFLTHLRATGTQTSPALIQSWSYLQQTQSSRSITNDSSVELQLISHFLPLGPLLFLHLFSSMGHSTYCSSQQTRSNRGAAFSPKSLRQYSMPIIITFIFLQKYTTDLPWNYYRCSSSLSHLCHGTSLPSAPSK